MKRYLTVILAGMLSLTVYADKMAEAIGDSIYDQLIEYYLKGKNDLLFKEKDEALDLFRKKEQWEYYYFLSSVCSMAKVTNEGQMLTGLRECRQLYEFARDHKHEYGRGIVLAQLGLIYEYMGNYEEALNQMDEAYKLLRLYPLKREAISLICFYAYTLEHVGNYKEEAAVLEALQSLFKHFDWGDTSPYIYQSYQDGLFNVKTLLEIRQKKLQLAGKHVSQLQETIANGTQHDEFEALRVIAEYYKACGDYALALAATDRMKPLVRNAADQWEFDLLRTGLLRLLNRADEAYDQLRPMVEMRSNYRANQLRQQISEVETMTELDELRIHKQEMRFWYTVVIAITIIIALFLYGIIRYRAERKLKKANTQLREAYDQLEETTTAKERIESDLRIARVIQMSMVPSSFPVYDGLDVYAAMKPAREVGGDLFDVQLIGQNDLCFCVGDVSGKGVPASLFMAQAIRLFRALSKLQIPPDEIAGYMNSELSDGNESGMFVTMFIGKIALDTGRLSFCNCGHNPPILGCGSNEARFMEMNPNVPIGLWDGIKYEGEVIDSIKGQVLFIYSDGLNEAENMSQEQFGDDHLLDILRQTPFSTSKELIEMLSEKVEAHRGGAVPNDDLTMLCLKIN